MCCVNSTIVLRQIRITIQKNSPINSDTEAQKALGMITDNNHQQPLSQAPLLSCEPKVIKMNFHAFE